MQQIEVISSGKQLVELENRQDNMKKGSEGKQYGGAGYISMIYLTPNIKLGLVGPCLQCSELSSIRLV